MTREIFDRLNIKEGDNLKVVYRWDRNTHTEESLKFRTIDEKGRVHLLTENWANDFYMIHLKQIIFIKKH